MILLIWDSCGEAELGFYEFIEEQEGTELVKACHNKYINSSEQTEEEDNNLNELSILLTTKPIIKIGPGNFGPYSAIYVSGFIP